MKLQYSIDLIYRVSLTLHCKCIWWELLADGGAVKLGLWVRVNKDFKKNHSQTYTLSYWFIGSTYWLIQSLSTETGSVFIGAAHSLIGIQWKAIGMFPDLKGSIGHGLQTKDYSLPTDKQPTLYIQEFHSSAFLYVLFVLVHCLCIEEMHTHHSHLWASLDPQEETK